MRIRMCVTVTMCVYVLHLCRVAHVCAQFPVEKRVKKSRRENEEYCNREASCFWLSIQPTNDLPGQFYVCLEES